MPIFLLRHRRLRTWVTPVILVFALMQVAIRQAPATDYTTNWASATSAYPGWPESNLYDGNTGTCWSSSLYSTPDHTESVSYSWSQGTQNVNYVKILPRYSGGNALSFPVNFYVYYWNGSSWVMMTSYTNYPIPFRGDWIILNFPSTVSTNLINIQATKLGSDGGSYCFQLAEVKAGYDAGFNQFFYNGNNTAALPGKNQIFGVKSNAFNPNKLNVWNYDDRGVVIQPNAGTVQNIYAPNAIYTGGNGWNIYFGGEDGAATSDEDRIYRTTTSDNFQTLGAHSLAINRGYFLDVNNESVVKLAANDWRMAYTTMGTSNPPTYGLNKTGYATSTDGINWTPSAGSQSYMLSMSGYNNWANGDFNGSNVIYKDAGGTWHLYFVDMATGAVPGNHHATSTNAVNYTYQGVAGNFGYGINDLKAFTYQSQTYYVGLYHNNGQGVWYTVGTSLTNLGASPTQAFANYGSADYYIATDGLVTDGTRVMGVLYGGTATWGPTFRIFARWMQKKVVFQNAYVNWSTNTGFGPDVVRLAQGAGDNVETGNFKVYDTDGTTLLYTSPTVTMRTGDIWLYTGP